MFLNMTQEQFEVLMLTLEFQEGVLFDNLRTSTIVFYKKHYTEYEIQQIGDLYLIKRIV